MIYSADNMYTEIHERIRLYSRDSLVELSCKSGVSFYTLKNWSRHAKNRPGLHTFISVSNALGFQVSMKKNEFSPKTIKGAK